MRRAELEAFGIAVRELRSKRGLSQEELAERSELHRTYISGIERGLRNPGLVNVQRIAAALGVRASELLALAEGTTRGRPTIRRA
jgi:transcriptional regulator with XRE-family HTH domain